MAITTIIGIALLAFAAVLLFVVLGAAQRQRRTAHRRVRAGDIRDRAAEQSHTVSECETLAERTAAQARLPHADGDAKTAHAAGPKHQAQAGSSDVATACDEVKKEFERADTIDPDSQTHDTSRRHPNPPHTASNPRRHARPATDEQSWMTPQSADGPDAAVTQLVRRPRADHVEGIGT